MKKIVVALAGNPNCGKTTLFRLLTGQEALETGGITYPNGARIGYFDQKVGEMFGCDVVEQAVRCRTIDRNGIAQPMPRPFKKSGGNAIQSVSLTVA